ncbi:MAG: tetratricopeptide repeat protein, partial [Clostridia bacterium]|nr:tetratricopeptide repeat protein [Clostridia bacterium]
TQLSGYKDSDDKITDCRYNSALALMNAGDYEGAMERFRLIESYKDSGDLIADCRYNAALDLYNAGKYDEAITAFKALNGYRDSEDQIINCETGIKYNTALELYNAGKYDEAITVFKALDGYKDSDTQLEKCYIGKYGEEQYNLIKDVKVGDTYRFGSYEQDNKTSNGKEEIEWIVLEKDGMSLLLISKYALDCQPYNTSDRSITWETCSLRKWLNGTFLDAAFSSEEQRSIISSTVTADKNPHFNTFVGKNTTDKVFLLSIKEANKYFSSDEARRCAPTEYAKAQGTLTYDSIGNCWWWLRSPGCDSHSAAFVFDDGSVSSYGFDVNNDVYTVRPAMWIDLGD